MSKMEDTVDRAKAQAADLATEAKDAASASAREQAETARMNALDEIEDAADATEAAQDEFEPNSLQAAALEQIGAQINSVAAQLRNKPVDAMVDDVAIFARKNPLLFLGGAALVGFAAARFMKSGDGTQSDDHDDPWSGHLQAAESHQ